MIITFIFIFSESMRISLGYDFAVYNPFLYLLFYHLSIYIIITFSEYLTLFLFSTISLIRYRFFLFP